MSTKDYGCFFCEGASTEPDGNCPQCQRTINVGTDLLGKRIGEYETLEVIGRGYYGWTVKVRDPYQEFAVKILPSHRLQRKEMPDEEARALASCSGHRNIVRFWRQITATISVKNEDVTVLCLVFDHIDNAKSLRSLLDDQYSELMKTDVVSILAGIAFGLSCLHTRDMWHRDLHDDNVLIREVEEDENLPERYEAKLIDFGSVRKVVPGEPEEEGRSDYYYLSKHIFNLAFRFETTNHARLLPPDRTFLTNLRRLGHMLSDKDVSRRSITPSDVAQEVRRALQESTRGQAFPSFEQMLEEADVSLTEPLTYTNALSLKPQDIPLLFVDSLGWVARLEKSEPVFIVGPRGCGKTMLLRFLSIASKVRPKKGESSHTEVAKRLSAEPYIAFLVQVGELRTPFFRPSYRHLERTNEALAEEFCREYINASFAFEIVRTVIWLNSERMIDLRQEDLDPLCGAVMRLLGVKRQCSGLSGLELLSEQLEARCRFLSGVPQEEAYKPSDLARDDALIELSRALKTLPWAADKDVWFLLDDYSMTVIPELAQKAYNPVLFRLSSEVRMRISSEGDGPILQDSLARKYKEGREFTRLNLGEVYFQSSEKDCRRFFEEILAQRFDQTRKGSLDQLKRMLGEHESRSNFGQYILRQHRPGDSRFYGFELICQLCSGDVSFIIELLHLLRAKWDGRDGPIAVMQQDAEVKRFAQRLLADLRSTEGYGPQLYEFALGVGNLLKQHLLKSKSQSEPDQRLRIEIRGTGQLSEEARELEVELLRHSVLIPGGSGKDKAGLPTKKLYFRRLFAPCFPFSPARKGCIDLTIQQYNTWLANPKLIWTEPQSKTEQGVLFQ